MRLTLSPRLPVFRMLPPPLPRKNQSGAAAAAVDNYGKNLNKFVHTPGPDLLQEALGRAPLRPRQTVQLFGNQLFPHLTGIRRA